MMTTAPQAGDRTRPARRTGLIRWGVLVVLLMLIAATLAVWSFRTPPAARAAKRAFAQGRYVEARARIDDWLRHSPQSAEAHLLKARCALDLGLVDETRQEWLRARELRASKDALDLYGAIVDANQGRVVQAEPILRRAYESSAEPDPQIDAALARVYLQTFQLKRAGAVLDRWSRDTPDDPRPYLWRAEIDFRSDHPNVNMINDFREALKRDSKLARARFGLAEALRKEHQNAEADVEYKTYLALRPDDPAGYLGAGRNALEIGDTDAALRFLERAVALDPKNAETYKVKADLALRQGDDKSALAQLDQAIRLDPSELDVHYSRGMVLKRLGRLDEAKAEQSLANRLRDDLVHLNELKHRLTERPNDLDLQIAITQWMFDHGHDDGAVQWALKIVKERPDHPRANRLLANYYDRAGNPGLANFYRLRAAPDGGAK